MQRQFRPSTRPDRRVISATGLNVVGDDILNAKLQLLILTRRILYSKISPVKCR